MSDADFRGSSAIANSAANQLSSSLAQASSGTADVEAYNFPWCNRKHQLANSPMLDLGEIHHGHGPSGLPVAT